MVEHELTGRAYEQLADTTTENISPMVGMSRREKAALPSSPYTGAAAAAAGELTH